MKSFLTILLITTPFFVLANAGSPMVWFNIFHLLFLNAVIGFIESEILAKYKLPNKTWLIIIANYISMVIGYYFIITNIVTTKYGRDIESGENLISGFMLCFLATLFIEYPFFIASLKDKKQRNKLLKPFLIANLITNIAMMIFYSLFVRN